MIQKVTSTMLRMLIPVKRPRIPPNPESLSKKESLLLLTVTDTVSLVSLKVTLALYGSISLHWSTSREVELKFMNSSALKTNSGGNG